MSNEQPEKTKDRAFEDHIAEVSASDEIWFKGFDEGYAYRELEIKRLHEVNQELVEALTEFQEQCKSMAKADWREWEELASPKEYERWVKSRAAHIAVQARAALAKAKGETE